MALHATRERDEAIAAGVGQVLREALKKRNGSRASVEARTLRQLEFLVAASVFSASGGVQGE